MKNTTVFSGIFGKKDLTLRGIPKCSPEKPLSGIYVFHLILVQNFPNFPVLSQKNSIPFDPVSEMFLIFG